MTTSSAKRSVAGRACREAVRRRGCRPRSSRRCGGGDPARRGLVERRRCTASSRRGSLRSTGRPGRALAPRIWTHSSGVARGDARGVAQPLAGQPTAAAVGVRAAGRPAARRRVAARARRARRRGRARSGVIAHGRRAEVEREIFDTATLRRRASRRARQITQGRPRKRSARAEIGSPALAAGHRVRADVPRRRRRRASRSASRRPELHARDVGHDGASGCAASSASTTRGGDVRRHARRRPDAARRRAAAARPAP